MMENQIEKTWKTLRKENSHVRRLLELWRGSTATDAWTGDWNTGKVGLATGDWVKEAAHHTLD